MAGKGINLDDYIEVAERIAAFKAAHPEGSLQAEIHTLTDALVVMKAYAYRSPDDQRPGVGWSSLGIPGATPYTRGSEIENCETSAWGRAIAALGFEVRRGIASAQEVRNKTQPQGAASTSRPTQRQPTNQQQNGERPVRNVGDVMNLARDRGFTSSQVLELLGIGAVAEINDFGLEAAALAIEEAARE